MPQENCKVKRIELVAYSRPHAERLTAAVDKKAAKDEVNYYLKVTVSALDREFVSAIEGAMGLRPDKPMVGRYWDYLETVASRLMGSQLDAEALAKGQLARQLKAWVEPTLELIDNAKALELRQWVKVQRAVNSIHMALKQLFADLARQIQREGNGEQPAEEVTSASEALFFRSERVLYLPEAEAPTYTYQPRLKDVPQEPSPPLHPNAFDDTPLMLPLGTMDAKSHLMERECLRQGFNVLRTGKGVFTADKGDQRFYFKLSRSPLVSVDAIALCTHKEATREFLAPLGFPVPRGRMFPSGDHDNAMRYANLIGYPVVVKPATGVRGIGVVPNIRSDEELRSAFHVLESSKLGHDDFIVEKHIFGEDYRIMVIGGKVRAATLRAPASVTGDGKHTIAELILIKNRYRQNIPHLKSRPIVYTESTQYQLDKLGYTLHSVPRLGERINLSGSCNLSQGGDSVNVHHEMHPSIIKVAEDAVKAVPGLDYCGIDFLIEDHRKPVGETDIGICELNAHAAIGTACYPMFGEPVNVPRQAIEAILHNQGMPLTPLDDSQVSVKVRVRGKVTGVGFRKWVSRHAQKGGLTGYVKNRDKRTVEAVLQGSLVAIASLATACIRGPSEALPTSVRVMHVKEPLHDGFTLIR
ncbi:acylphosphatase [Halomonas maura]|uniref:acylphosphatase n=1 Tax=Halomonas maura TaxID=117606 RepID=UPI0025B300AF|nr:acylphosphatase [Halomonas maura]MDN3557467.1 acylphosphatase [Halomonas maura]